MRSILTLAMVLLASSLSAQFIKHPPNVVVADLPTCDSDKNGRILSVTDGISSTDCSVGGGSTTVLCLCGGSSWALSTGSEWTDTGATLHPNETGDEVVLGATSPVSSAKFSVDGDADQIQALIQGNATQTVNIFEVENSAASSLFTVAGNGAFSFSGAGTMTNGSLELGQNDSTSGAFNVYGDGAGATGGIVHLFTGADHDTTVNSYSLRANEDDFGIWNDTSGVALVEVGLTGVMSMLPIATAPATCSIGDIYIDTSGAACFCTATNTWSNAVGTGACT